MTGTDLKLSSCALTVHDVDEMLDFYRDVLGFEVRDDAGSEGTRRVSVGPPAQPDVRVLLQAPGTQPSISPADRQTIEDLIARGLLSGGLVFVTGDCDATFERIEAAGAEVMQEPISRPDGVRDCAFFDPSGNTLRFTQPPPAVKTLTQPQAQVTTARRTP
ncbi:VOC family protein [Actinomadura terrae]|uniref:VOC family protein n=1 Tax=Actinomadura terrae TaxID=604353 RepID=UPI001FA6F79A|nr:VOC family protein [Actinomadura terrae]